MIQRWSRGCRHVDTKAPFSFGNLSFPLTLFLLLCHHHIYFRLLFFSPVVGQTIPCNFAEAVCTPYRLDLQGCRNLCSFFQYMFVTSRRTHQTIFSSLCFVLTDKDQRVFLSLCQSQCLTTAPCTCFVASEFLTGPPAKNSARAPRIKFWRGKYPPPVAPLFALIFFFCNNTMSDDESLCGQAIFSSRFARMIA